ncbi:tRNA (N6-threonylcarbamoyladenosine(37)-N6)-methyltransferase TrmO [Bdellovibrio sp. NC01]|uniref:tRNA (N6-threonylcarbamoyladenosine(37)-N6)-methyltransferase TrmO n=1 Tax=Bdellovibrio sp. NC01 TaxID=2220073 RepID=UPI001159CD05|nr:tRNA (N6-threonylcarbamoyladenosine(37)-N6)-methyltransferase TrmO [Bdellovibrio sp. NC01]QDK38110.1 tRNA (N6-threonylcarbamoyladenosine(37)-N6)-methyltransferase TrmO [Bdellovibrio sp. NC01]
MKKHGEVFEFAAIGHVQTPFKDKFGIPRQPGLVSQAKGVIKMQDDPDLKTALRSLEEFSHLWIVFVFHEHGGKNWKPSIRPPRLGGNRKVGVLASRSPHRPNPIGMSAVILEKVDWEAKGGVEIHVAGVDLLDGTPVLDLKPYIPYADSIPDANPGWASDAITRIPVQFSDEALAEIAKRDPNGEQNLKALIIEVLELDPRPAFKKRQAPSTDPAQWGTRYGFDMLGNDVKYEIREGHFYVYAIL